VHALALSDPSRGALARECECRVKSALFAILDGYVC
jgi:hypothetical protein